MFIDDFMNAEQREEDWHKGAPTKVRLLARHMMGVIASLALSFSHSRKSQQIKYLYHRLENTRSTVFASGHQLIESVHNLFINNREEHAQVPR